MGSAPIASISLGDSNVDLHEVAIPPELVSALIDWPVPDNLAPRDGFSTLKGGLIRKR